MASKKPASSKRAVLPRRSDFTKAFAKDWERLSHSGRYDLNRLKEVMLLLIANDAPLPAEWQDHALKMQRDAQRRRVLAPAYDPVRRDFELGLADEMEREPQLLLTPAQTLQKGLGGEIIPPPEEDLPGLELTLKEPDLLNLGASEQRAGLLERAGVLELGIETAQDAKADGSIQKMLSHQMAALHARGMTLLAESDLCKDPDIAIKKARASARMVDAFSRAALTLQRLQNAVGQTLMEHRQKTGRSIRCALA